MELHIPRPEVLLLDLVTKLTNRLDLLVTELDERTRDILLGVLHLLASRERDYVGALRHEPREGDLRGRRAVVRLSDPLKLVGESVDVDPVLGGEAGELASGVVLPEIVDRALDVGKESESAY